MLCNLTVRLCRSASSISAKNRFCVVRATQAANAKAESLMARAEDSKIQRDMKSAFTLRVRWLACARQNSRLSYVLSCIELCIVHVLHSGSDKTDGARGGLCARDEAL